jgi:hypothetical protein
MQAVSTLAIATVASPNGIFESGLKGFGGLEPHQDVPSSPRTACLIAHDYTDMARRNAEILTIGTVVLTQRIFKLMP